MRRLKCSIPLLPPQFVERDEVRAALDGQSVGGPSGNAGRVVLVSAPTGHGKTAAVTDWVHASVGEPTAWVSLDESDRDEAPWWRSVLDALAASPAVAEDSALHRLRLPAAGGERWARESFVAAMQEALEALPVPVRLVLDDVHEIVGHPAEAALRALVRHPVHGLTLVLCSRVDPPIGLDRLRLEGRLGELRVDKLTFSVEDAARLFAQASLPLSLEQTSALVKRTEGWIAALRLLALSLQDGSDPSAVVADFAGDDRSVADYLTDEVLAKLDERERRILEATCICSPIAVDLARALTEDPGASEVLEHLEATAAMVRATDRRGDHYQAHELLRSHVLARLRRHDKDRLFEVYRRASAWFEAQDDVAEALHYAALAGDVAATKALLRTHAVDLLGAGAFASLRGSDELLWSQGADSWSQIVLGLAALENGEIEHATALFEAAGAEEPDEAPDTAVLRGIATIRLALAHGHLHDAAQEVKQMSPHTVHGAPLRTLALATRGYAAATGDPQRARDDADEALSLAREHHWPYLVAQARVTLAFSQIHGAQLAAAAENARAVLDLAAHHGWKDTPLPVGALVVLGVTDVLGGRPEQALADVTQAEGVAAVRHGEYRNILALLQGAAEYDSGRRTEGWQLMRAARLQALAQDLDDRYVAFAALLEQQAALGLGRRREAAELVGAVGARLDGTGDGAVIHARQHWDSTQDPRARLRLRPALEDSRLFLTSLAATEARVLDAEIALAAGAHSHVRHRVREALRDADEHGMVRPLLYASPTLHDYLEKRRGGFGAHDHTVTRVLAAARRPAPSPGGALTRRELEVVELLSTLQSVEEIAHDLAVSTNTVRTHKRSIYQKLGADNRRDAVAQAHRAGLLERPD